jgi:hypothetical protein
VLLAEKICGGEAQHGIAQKFQPLMVQVLSQGTVGEGFLNRSKDCSGDSWPFGSRGL